jgi:uncharacterized protein YnzC (UPF0291/DUF896 family)
MSRGSKPGERRGGRKLGTPNKKTLLRNAFMGAVAADPNLLPLDFFLRLMRQSTLPPAIRVYAAEEALPFVHPKPRLSKKPQAPPPQDGGSQPRVKLRRKTDADPSDLDELDLRRELQDGCNESDNTDGAPLQPGLTEPSEGPGPPDEPVAQPGAAEPSIQPGSAAPALQTALAGAEAAKPTGGEAQGAGAKALTPLAFLRAVMRHRDTPMHLRLRVASILAPYLHAKATPEAESEAEFVVEDQYGFSVEPGLAKNLMDTEKALYELPHWWTKGEGSYEEQQDVLRKRLALAKKSLRCPETYRWQDLAKDNGRLSQLAAKRKAQGLTPPEDAEEIHLRARTFSHENGAEHAEREGRRDRLDALYAKWKDYSITEAEQQEFDDLRASLRDIDPDPVRSDFRGQLFLEARIRGLPEPTPEEADKMLAAKESSADIIRGPAKTPRQWQPGSEDVDFAAWLRGEIRYPPYLLRKAAYARYRNYHNASTPVVPDLVVALVRDQEVVFEDELSPYFARVLQIYDEALNSGKSPQAASSSKSA